MHCIVSTDVAQHKLCKPFQKPRDAAARSNTLSQFRTAMIPDAAAQECLAAACELVLKAPRDDSASKPKPVVYSSLYNISFFYLEKLHPFDPCKYAKVVKSLRSQGLIDDVSCFFTESQHVLATLHENVLSALYSTHLQVWEPCEVPKEVLEAVHSKAYLKKLHSSPLRVAHVVELPPLAILPMCLINHLLLRKLRVQTGGTILSAALAVKEGWSINVGGGMHHASFDNGEGSTLLLESKHVLLLALWCY